MGTTNNKQEEVIVAQNGQNSANLPISHMEHFGLSLASGAFVLLVALCIFACCHCIKLRTTRLIEKRIRLAASSRSIDTAV